MVEAPCATPRCRILATARARCRRIDAVMLVEAAILDGDEGLRHVARQFLQRQHGAAVVAAGGERAAVDVDDLDRGRPLGDLQRLQRRQMRAGPGDGADAADDEPQPQHQAPIDRAADQRALAARACAICLARLRLAGGLPAPPAGGRPAPTRNSGALSNTGSRRAPDCPRPAPSRDPTTHAGGFPPAPVRHAKRGGLRGR